MVNIDIVYSGDLHCDAVHTPSASRLSTDAPVDNHGRGETFSPTDLCATALVTCMLTIMGIRARQEGIPFPGARARVEKHMTAAPPRRIARLAVEIAPTQAVTPGEARILEEAAGQCPVLLSLHPDIRKDVTFIWPD